MVFFYNDCRKRIAVCVEAHMLQLWLWTHVRDEKVKIHPLRSYEHMSGLEHQCVWTLLIRCIFPVDFKSVLMTGEGEVPNYATIKYSLKWLTFLIIVQNLRTKNIRRGCTTFPASNITRGTDDQQECLIKTYS